ncbi:MAG: hypothetical protein ACW98F_12445 [Candidatus Hodarchaeales archaeon]
MEIVQEDEFLTVWVNLVYPQKQLRKRALELTIKSIDSFYSQGQLDFGGGEFRSAILEKVTPIIEDDPKYAWWSLSPGQYLLTYNEILNDMDYFALIYPLTRLFQTGSTHASFHWAPTSKNQQISTILQVGEKGIRLKENSRISTAVTYKNSQQS